MHSFLVLFRWRALTDTLPFAKNNSGWHRGHPGLTVSRVKLQKETSSFQAVSEPPAGREGLQYSHATPGGARALCKGGVPAAGPAPQVCSLGFQDDPMTQQGKEAAENLGKGIPPRRSVYTARHQRSRSFDVSFLGSPISGRI